jgi:hypothetical protein
VVRGAARLRRIRAIEAQGDQVEFIDEDIDEPNRVVLCNEVVQALRKQRDLMSILSLDEARHANSQAWPGAPIYAMAFKCATGFHTASLPSSHRPPSAGRLHRVGTVSSSSREAVTGEARARSRKSYGRSTSKSRRSAWRWKPG